MKLKHRLRLTGRVIALHWRINRDLLLAKAGAGLTAAIGPILAVWFSAQILNCLTAQAEAQILLNWVLAAIFSGALVSILNRISTNLESHIFQSTYRRNNKLYSEKFMSLDFEDVENARIRGLLTEIERNDNYSGLGLNKILWEMDDFFEGATSIVAGLGLTLSLFSMATKISEYSWLNYPISGVLVLLLIICAAALSARMAAIRVGLWIRSDNAEIIKRGNVFWRYYSLDLARASEKGMDIRIYSMSGVIDRFLKEWDQSEGHFFQRLFRSASAFSAVESIAGTVCYGITYLFVALKALGGAFGVGSVVQYVGAISRFSDGVNKFVRSGTAILSAAEYLESTFELLDIPNRKYMGTLTVEKRSDNKYDVEFRDVSFQYPGSDTYALRHMNLKFQIGRRLAVVGMNGSGKTTMIKLLCRLYDPTEGEILLNGIDIRKYNYDEYMSLFSVVFQDFQLFSFPLGQNVASRVDYDRKRAAECLRLAGFGDRLGTLDNGLDTYLGQDFDENGVEMSGGESQKIALARALYKNAPFMILDEPTAALDPLAEYEIYAKFNEIIGDHTAVYISHRLSSCRFCDDIAVFHEGQVIQFGTHDSLLEDASGKYYELWNAQAQYYAPNKG